MRTFSFLPGALAFLLAAVPALADPPEPELPHRFRLEYSRAPNAMGCPDELHFHNVVSVYLRATPSSIDPEAKARLIVKLHREGPVYLATSELRDEAGKVLWEKVVREHDCQLLAGAVGLELEITLSPRRPKPESAPSAPPPPPPAPPQPAGAPITPTERKVEFGLGGALALGKVPSVAAPELFADGRVRGKVLSLGGEVSFIPPMAADFPFMVPITNQASSMLVRTSRLTLGFVPCGHVRWFFACGLAQFSTLITWGFWDMAHQDAPIHAGPAAGLGGRLGADLALQRRLGLRFSADLMTMIPRSAIQRGPLFAVAPVAPETLWTMPWVSGALAVRLVATF